MSSRLQGVIRSVTPLPLCSFYTLSNYTLMGAGGGDRRGGMGNTYKKQRDNTVYCIGREKMDIFSCFFINRSPPETFIKQGNYFVYCTTSRRYADST